MRKETIIMPGLILVLALVAGRPVLAQGTEVELGPITNNSIYATQSLVEYLIQASSAGNGTVSGDTNDWIEAGENFSVSASADEHYHFVSWNNGSSANPLEAPATSPTNLVASFAIDTYTVDIQAGDFDIAPTNFAAVAYGNSVTTTVQSIYVTNAPGVRVKFTGFEKIQ